MIHQDPNFGYDGYGPLLVKPAPELPILGVDASTGYYHGADAYGVYVNSLPVGPYCYFSYVDNLGGWSQLRTRFPAIREWTGKPWGYCAASSMQSLIDVAAGRDFVRASAHYGIGPHICSPHVCGYPQADWTQWIDKGANGENIDRWVGRSTFGQQLPALVSITILNNVAHFGDVEPGALSLHEFPDWYDNKAIKAKPTPSPPKPPKPPSGEKVTVINTAIDSHGVVHVVQETSSGKVYHVRQTAEYGKWASGATLILDNGIVPKGDVAPAGSGE